MGIWRLKIEIKGNLLFKKKIYKRKHNSPSISVNLAYSLNASVLNCTTGTEQIIINLVIPNKC